MGPLLVEYQPLRTHIDVHPRWISLHHLRRQPGLRLVGLEQHPTACRRPAVERTALQNDLLQIDLRFSA